MGLTLSWQRNDRENVGVEEKKKLLGGGKNLWERSHFSSKGEKRTDKNVL